MKGEKGEVRSLSEEDLYQLNKTIKRVTDDIKQVKYNTAIAGLMEWLNYLSRKTEISLEEYKTYLILLAPFAPHMTEELYHRVEPDAVSIHTVKWAQIDEKHLKQSTVTIAIQVNGKLRGTVTIEASASKDDIIAAARATRGAGGRAAAGESEKAEGRCQRIMHIAGQGAVFAAEGGDRCGVFFGLRHGGAYFCGADEVAAGQYPADDQADDDQHYRKLDKCEAGFYRISIDRPQLMLLPVFWLME